MRLMLVCDTNANVSAEACFEWLRVRVLKGFGCSAMAGATVRVLLRVGGVRNCGPWRFYDSAD